MPNATDRSLADARLARGLTQQALASVLGIARSSLSCVENGHVRPWPRLRSDASRILGVAEGELFGSPHEDLRRD
jgi:transcriptional regulator with XRE-family HTH domain